MMYAYEVAIWDAAGFGRWEAYFAPNRSAVRDDLALRGICGVGEIRLDPTRTGTANGYDEDTRRPPARVVTGRTERRP